MGKYNHTVTKEEVGLTVNQILRQNYSFSRRFKTKMKYQELVDLNGIKTPGHARPSLGDTISVRLPEEHSDFPSENIPLDIVYEDNDLLILNKQAGVTVHPTKGHPNGTLANGIMYYMKEAGQDFKIRFCNRLDMDTSGLIIVAKNSNIQNEVSRQMQRNKVIKKYYALVNGIIENDSFLIDLPVGRPNPDTPRRAVLPEEHGGKKAITEIHVIKRFDKEKTPQIPCNATLVELTLHTGRTHQIRIHMSHLGHPLLGDKLYNGASFDLIDRQALHSRYVMLKHPATGDLLELIAPLPSDIQSVIKVLGGIS